MRSDFMQNSAWQVEVDRATSGEWAQMLDLFDDANIYQTWSYGGFAGEWEPQPSGFEARWRGSAMAQVRIVRPTRLKFGMAYLRWGPIFERRGSHERFGSRQRLWRAPWKRNM